MSLAALAQVEPIAPGALVLRVGKWTIRYEPRPSIQLPEYVFTHDDFNGTPDISDDRHGLGASLEHCLERIAEIDSWGREYG